MERIIVTGIYKSTMAVIISVAFLMSFSGVDAVEGALKESLIDVQKLINHGKLEEATAESEKILEQFPDSVEAYDLLFGAVNYLIPMNYRMVKKQLYPGGPPMETMEFISPEELRPAYDSIWTKIDKVKKRITGLLGQNSESALLHYVMGMTMMTEVNIDFQYQMAVGMHKGNYKFPPKDSKKKALALEEINKAIEYDPGFSYAYAFIGSIKINDTVEKQMTKAMSGGKTYDVYSPPALYEDLRDMLLEGEKYSEKAISLNEKSSGAYFALAEAYKLEGDFKKQLAAIKKAVAYDPYNAMMRFSLGRCYLDKINRYLYTPFQQGQGRPSKMAALKKDMMTKAGITQEDINRWSWNAIYAYETATKLTSSSSKYFQPKMLEQMIDRILRMMVIEETISKDYERVISILAKQLRANPESPTLHSALGYYYTVLWGKVTTSENLKKAIKFYEKAIELAPNQFSSHMDLVVLYVVRHYEGEAGALEKAKQEYKWIQDNDDTKDSYFKKALDANLYWADIKVKMLK